MAIGKPQTVGLGGGFSVSTFVGEEKEDVNLFLDTVGLSFFTVENTLPVDRRARAKITHLHLYLKGDAFTC